MGGFELTTEPDVYKRWLQFGLLSTHSRLHGSKSYRVPWLFDEEAVDVCRKFTKLKLRLLPYLYSMAVKSHKTGIPSMRAMIMEFNDDPATKYLDMQYMLGESILVAPIFNKEGHAEYYLPAGKWTHLLSGGVSSAITNPRFRSFLWKYSYIGRKNASEFRSTQFAIVALVISTPYCFQSFS